MNKEVINPPSLGPAVGPFSRAVRIGDMLYIAGTSALSHLSGQLNERYLPASIEEQTRLTYDNIKKVVEAAGGTMADIFKTTVLIKHDKDYATINKIRGAYFPNAGLISTAFVCDLIRPDMLIEVEAQAYLPVESAKRAVPRRTRRAAPDRATRRRPASIKRRRSASTKRGTKARRRLLKRGSAKRPRSKRRDIGTYRDKRDFKITPEPAAAPLQLPGGDRRAAEPRFVVQLHSATRLHYDLRLEIGSVLASWAVTKGPSLDPKVKRLAVHVEDHPLAYADFEGVIPAGQYGAGPVIVWDRGTYAAIADMAAQVARGEVKFRLYGTKLNGGFSLVRLKGAGNEDGKNWLLIKERDIFVKPEAEGLVTDDAPASVVSGRRVDELAANEAGEGASAAAPEAVDPIDPGSLAGARRAAMPATIRPMLASLANAPPDGDGWLHEIKFDGYRTLARMSDGAVQLITRNGHDWTAKYAPIAAAFAALPVKSAAIDGEVCVQDEHGRTSFHRLQDALASGIADKLVFFAFDLVHHDGIDLAKIPLAERRRALRALLAPHVGERTPIQLSDHVAGSGPAFFAEAARLGLEGILSKRADSPYRSGRSDQWLKVKCVATADFTIIGFTESKAAGGLASLIVAETTPTGLASVGRVGTGYTAASAADLRDLLRAHRRTTAPVAVSEDDARGRPVWVEPNVVAEVEYRGRTGDGHLRGAVFKRVQDAAADPARTQDARPARHVTDSDLAAIWITNPDRRMFADDGPTKLEIALCYAKVGDWMLPGIKERPLTLVRCPTGKAEDCFYQRHLSEGMPADVKRIALAPEGEERGDFLYVEDAKGLLALAQFGVIEFHPWGCRVDQPERPDRLVFDLDPDEGVAWRTVVAAAHDIRREIEALDLLPFVRTTGGKGLHIVVPIERRSGWDEAKAFSQGFVTQLAKKWPQRFTASPAKNARRGKIFIDWIRNARGATAVGSYSLRARVGLPAATPLGWSELDRVEDPRDFTYASLPARLTALTADPWRALDQSAGRLTARHLKKLSINK